MRDGGSKAIQLHPEFLAAVQDAETYEAAVACAKGQGWPAQSVVNADVASVISSVSRSHPPAIIIVDVDGAQDPATMVGQLVKVCAERSHVLVIGSANDIMFYRGMVQAGAADYLVKPLSSVAMRDAVVPLLAAKAGSDKGERKKSGLVTVLIGVRGGVGLTTMATNTAWVLAHEIGQRTALLDLDLQFGNSDLALDLEPGRGLREVLTSPERMDSLLINSSMAKESDSLSVFCCEESLEEVIDFDTSGPMSLVKELRSDYDCILVDMPRYMVPRHRRFIVSADRIVLMTDMTLAGIRDTQRIMAAIANLGTAAPVHVIAGRIGDGEAQISRAQFERGTKAKLEALIPHDTKTVKLAANRGKSIFAVGGGTSALAKSVRSLAGFIVPAGVPTAGAAAAAEGGFLGKLFGGKG